MRKTRRALSVLLALSLVAGTIVMSRAGGALPVFRTAQNSGDVIQLTDRIQTGGPGATLTGDKVLIVNNGDTRQSTGTLPAMVDLAGQNPVNNSSGGSAPVAAVIEMAEPAPGADSEVHYTIGQRDTIASVDCTLIAEGEHCYIWMRNDLQEAYEIYEPNSDTGNYSDLAEQAGRDFADVYDNYSYNYLISACTDTSVAGWSDPIPYRDGSGKVHIVLGNTSSSLGFYVSAEKAKTAFHINIPTYPGKYTYATAKSTRDLIVHEGQHLLFDHFNPKAQGKITAANEGLAVTLAMYMRGNDDWLSDLKDNGSIRLGQWTLLKSTTTTLHNYNFHYLFFRYLITQLAGQQGQTFNTQGTDSAVFRFFRTFYSREDDGTDLDAFLAACGIEGIASFDEAVPAFYLALAAQESGGKYGFYDDPIFRSGFGDFPVYYAYTGEKISMEPRTAILVMPQDGSFVVPDDGWANVSYYAIRDKETEGGGSEEPEQPEDPVPDGTVENPYLIATPEDFNRINNYPAACYKLTADITLPSGYLVGSFTGILDGDGHRITVSGTPISYSEGTVKNICFQISETASEPFSMISSNYGLVSDCVFTGSASFVQSTSESDSYIEPACLVSWNNGKIRFCTVDVNLAYSIDVPTEIDGDNTAFLCYSNYGEISDCLTAGKMAIKENYTIYWLGFGAVAYLNLNSGTISRCLALTDLEIPTPDARDAPVGTVVGINYGNVSNVYYKAGDTPIGRDSGSSSGLSGNAEESLTDRESFPMLDLQTVWKMGTSHPVLRSESERMSSADTVTAEATGTLVFGLEPKLHEVAVLKLNGNVTDLVTNDMVDLTPLYAMSEPGPVTLQGSCAGKSFTLALNVAAPETIADLQTMNSGKTQYFEGDTYSSQGVSLKATINGNSAVIKYGFTVDMDGRILSAQDTAATVTYCGQEFAIPLTVKIPQVKTILPARQVKLAYQIGETPGEIGDVMLELRLDNGAVVYTTYEEGRERYGLHIYGAPPGNTSNHNGPIYADEADAWLTSSLDVGYHNYDILVFAGEPIEGAQMSLVYDLIGKLQVGYKTAYSLVREDGTPYMKVSLREGKKYTKEEALAEKDGMWIYLHNLYDEENGVVIKYELKEWQEPVIDDEALIVYHTAVLKGTPSYELMIQYVLPRGVSYSSRFLSASRRFRGGLDSLDKVEALAQEKFISAQDDDYKHLGLEGTTPVRLKASSLEQMGHEIAETTYSTLVTRYTYQIKFQKEDCEGPITLQILDAGTVPSSAPQLPEGGTCTAREAGERIAELLAGCEQNTLIEDKYYCTIGFTISGDTVICTRTWKELPDSNGVTLLTDWGENAPKTRAEYPEVLISCGVTSLDYAARYLNDALKELAYFQPGDTINDVRQKPAARKMSRMLLAAASDENEADDSGSLDTGYWTFEGYDTENYETDSANNTLKLKGNWNWTSTSQSEEETEYTVAYDWGGEAPEGKTLPTDSTAYASEELAKAAMDTTFGSTTEVRGTKDGKDGTWKFSGWTAATSGTVVTFTGSWSFAPDYTVVYDWGDELPEGKTLPTDSTAYAGEELAKAAMDTTFKSTTKVRGTKDGKEGTWKFTGWTAATDGTVVTFTGSWVFWEDSSDTPDTPQVPSDATHTPSNVTSGGAVRASKGSTDIIAGVVVDDQDMKLKVEVPTTFAFVVNGTVTNGGSDAVTVENGGVLLPNIRIKVDKPSTETESGTYHLEVGELGNWKFTNYSTKLTEAGDAREGLAVDVRGEIKNEGTPRSRNYWTHTAAVTDAESDFKKYTMSVTSDHVLMDAETGEVGTARVDFNTGQTSRNLGMGQKIRIPAPDASAGIDEKTGYALTGREVGADFSVSVGGKRGNYTQIEQSAKIGTVIWTIETPRMPAANTAPNNAYQKEAALANP